MVKKSIHITDKQDKKLKEITKKTEITEAEILRRILEYSFYNIDKVFPYEKNI